MQTTKGASLQCNFDLVWRASAIGQDAYFKPYHTLADKYRAYWADPAHMDVLISCPSLGLSALSQAEKQILKPIWQFYLKAITSCVSLLV